MTSVPVLPAGAYTGAGHLFAVMAVIVMVIAAWCLISCLFERGKDERKRNKEGCRSGVGHGHAVYYRKNCARGK